MSQANFNTNVVTGSPLLALSENVRSWQKRDCYQQLNTYVLYRGESLDTEDGVQYLNAEQFLSALADIKLRLDAAELSNRSEENKPGFHLTM